MGYFGIGPTATGLTVAVVLLPAPTADAEHFLLLQTYIFKLGFVCLVAGYVLFQTHRLDQILGHAAVYQIDMIDIFSCFQK